MISSTSPSLTAQGEALLTDPAHLGELRESQDIAGSAAALRARMREDGYLFLRGYLDIDRVMAARTELLSRAAAAGALDPDAPLMDGLLAPDVAPSFEQDTTNHSSVLHDLLFRNEMLALWQRFLGDEVRHFDFIWLRSKSPGKGTPPHGDSVFMNRGTPNLFTAWTPLGDIDTTLGGLMILERSHRNDDVRSTYGARDVDEYCENIPEAVAAATQTPGWTDRNGEAWDGTISRQPVRLQQELGGRWLTTTFHPGDLLVFGMHTLHASLDNQTGNQLRLSTDTRYQLASEPVDERWIGEKPVGHGPEGKRAVVC